MASHEKVTLPMAGSFIPFSGDNNRKQGISVGVRVCVSVSVTVGVFVSAGVGVFVLDGIAVKVLTTFARGLTALLQAARNPAPKPNKVSLRKSRRENLSFIFSFAYLLRGAPNGLRYLRVGGRGQCLGAGKTRSQKNA